MSVYLRGGTYHYEFEYKGQRMRGSCGTTNRNTALTVERSVREECHEKKFGVTVRKKDVPTLKEFGEETFLSELRMRHKDQPGTLRFYLHNFRELCEYKPLGNETLDEIDEKLIQKFTAHCAETKKLSNSTTNRRLGTLRKAMFFAKEMKVIKGAPKFNLFREPPSRDYILPRGEDEEFYLAHCTKALYEFAVISLESGMRMGECLRLKWEDVFFESAGSRPYIHCRGKKSRYADRKIPMSKKLYEHLKEMEADKVSEWVLTRVKDRSRPASMWTLEDAHENMRNKYNLHPKFVLHSLRHTMATRMGEAGASAFAIQKVMGHSSVMMSQRYVHPTAGEIDRAFDMLDKRTQPAVSFTETRQLTLVS